MSAIYQMGIIGLGLYVGYFLMAENHKGNAEAALEIFDQFVTAAKKWGKKHICYIQVLCDESRIKESPETLITTPNLP